MNNNNTSKVIIAPSIATCNLMKIGEELLKISSAEYIHFDVMDGHFVPLLTIGVPFLEQIRKLTTQVLDVHIMVTNPEATFQNYLNAGADILTFHPELSYHSYKLCQSIQSQGKKSGIALNPATHPSTVEFLLPVLNQITVMSVNPGFSGQSHISDMLEKVKYLKNLCVKKGFSNVQIQVDGGVNLNNIAQLYQAGACVFVAGASVFHEPNYALAIEKLKSAALV
jgi:ribulose-phosphate 3-epimerase